MDQNLREQVVQQVRSEIISGQSPPGTMYSVPSLAESLGISTTPVREALLELSRGGLIEPMRNRGFKVVEPSEADLRNLFDLREVLELHAAEVVARKPGAALDDLYRRADDIARAVREEDMRLYLEADRAYHRVLTAAADNPMLTDMVMGLRDKMRLYGITSRSGLARQQESVPEHYEIADLAKAGDAPALAILLRRHIRAWEPVFLEALSRTGKDLVREPLVAARGRR